MIQRDGMNQWTKKLPTWLAPIIGAGGIGVCPLCWVGSAALLTYVGLGALIPWWRWISFALVGIGLIGFLLDYRAHKNIYPTLILVIGGILLYLGRYVFGGEGFGGWPIWGLGAVLVILAVLYNKRLFSKPVVSSLTNS